MYIYFLPLTSNNIPSTSGITSTSDAVIPVPTHDGGLEHTEARFLPASKWISMQDSGEVILFPPQLFLLHLLSKYLPEPASSSDGTIPKEYSHDELLAQRSALKQFVKTSDPPWGEKVMSPTQIMRRKEDGRNVLALDKPGPELEGTDRRGDSEFVVLVNFKKEGPRDVEVRLRKEVFEDERHGKEKL